MKKMLILFCCAFAFSNSIAQELWQEILPPTVDPACIAVSSAGNIFVNYEADLHRSTNNGQSWENINPGPPGFSYVATSPTGVIYSINDLLRKSTDEGNTWIALQSPVNPYLVIREPNPMMTNSLGDIFIQFDNYPNRETYRSTNGGNSWIEIGIDSSKMVDIIFKDNLCFASFWGPGIDGLLYRSTNNGDDWELIPSAPTGLYTLLSANNGMLYGGRLAGGSPPGNLFVSKDNGISWEVVSEFNGISLYDIVENQLGHIFVAVGHGVYRSIDLGVSWHPFTSGLLHIPTWKLVAGPLGFLYAGTGVPQMLYGTANTTIPVELVSFTALQIDYEVRLNWETVTELNNLGFEIERCTDKSEWRTIGFKEGIGTTTEIQNYLFVDDNISNGKYYYRLKQIDFDGTFSYSKIIGVEVHIIHGFSLEQNYPNPFNPTTKITYSIPRNSQVSLSVYNLLGEKVESLVNEEQSVGSYKVKFDATALPSGIYFYRLKAGSYLETKRMILLK